MTNPDEFEDERPIALLATLVEDVPETLGQRVRSGIQRRILAADVTEFSFSHVFAVFLEFVKIIFESLGSGPKRGDEE